MSSTPAAGSFRDLLAHFPTGVVAITALSAGQPVGLAAGSFFSVSLEPPLIGFGVAHTSTSWPHIAAAPGFAVSILAADQAHISKILATPGPAKFSNVDWRLSPGGSPIISGAVAYLDCAHHGSHPAGDHELIIGRVLRYDTLQGGAPLVFHRRDYWSTGEQPVTARPV
ncbi:flavin reductase family protein [Allorhizocola rhizosphaerae]|uniref:flavin reductase family protein n=1 Tax=Allorhizocola rhizosphaerae TaxID=1872709 RepID=UPI000E3BCC99|nr:flavin reductase family protein [Allorhizocola rhizosphaerae]